MVRMRLLAEEISLFRKFHLHRALRGKPRGGRDGGGAAMQIFLKSTAYAEKKLGSAEQKHSLGELLGASHRLE